MWNVMQISTKCTKHYWRNKKENIIKYESNDTLETLSGSCWTNKPYKNHLLKHLSFLSSEEKQKQYNIFPNSQAKSK